MRKRISFISVLTMFLAIGFVIIFSRPVKAVANGVILKSNRTYTAYDVTGDGTKDKIRIRASNQTDDEAYSSLTVSVNGKTAYRLKNTRFYNVIANIYTLKNGQPFLYLYAPAENGDGPVCALLKYTKDYFVVPEEHIVVMKADSITLYTMDGTVVEPKMLHVDWDTTAAQKGGYDFFMQKETIA